MLCSSSLALLLAGGVVSVVAQDGYGNTNHTAPGGNDSLANAPYSTSLLSSFLYTSSRVCVRGWSDMIHLYR